MSRKVFRIGSILGSTIRQQGRPALPGYDSIETAAAKWGVDLESARPMSFHVSRMPRHDAMTFVEMKRRLGKFIQSYNPSDSENIPILEHNMDILVDADRVAVRHPLQSSSNFLSPIFRHFGHRLYSRAVLHERTTLVWQFLGSF